MHRRQVSGDDHGLDTLRTVRAVTLLFTPWLPRHSLTSVPLLESAQVLAHVPAWADRVWVSVIAASARSIREVAEPAIGAAVGLGVIRDLGTCATEPAPKPLPFECAPPSRSNVTVGATVEPTTAMPPSCVSVRCSSMACPGHSAGVT